MRLRSFITSMLLITAILAGSGICLAQKADKRYRKEVEKISYDSRRDRTTIICKDGSRIIAQGRWDERDFERFQRKMEKLERSLEHLDLDICIPELDDLCDLQYDLRGLEDLHVDLDMSHLEDAMADLEYDLRGLEYIDIEIPEIDIDIPDIPEIYFDQPDIPDIDIEIPDIDIEIPDIDLRLDMLDRDLKHLKYFKVRPTRKIRKDFKSYSGNWDKESVQNQKRRNSLKIQ